MSRPPCRGFFTIGASEAANGRNSDSDSIEPPSSAASSPPAELLSEGDRAAELAPLPPASTPLDDWALSEVDGFGVNSLRRPLPPADELPPPPDCEIETPAVATTTTARAVASTGTRRRVGVIPLHQSASGAKTEAVVSAPRGKPAAARWSSSAANSGRGFGRS